MTPVVSDGQLLHRCIQAINGGSHLTALFMDLRAERVSVSERRLRRLWLEAGGKIRPKTMLYAPGTGPLDR